MNYNELYFLFRNKGGENLSRTFKKLSINEFEEYIKNFNFTRTIKEFHVHHTWKPDHITLRKAKSYEAVIYSMYKYHTETNGWSDIGQNITIDDNGDVWLCRDFNTAPASIKGRNSIGFACEMIGNFDKGNDVLNGKQLESVIRAIRVIKDKCGFDNNGIIFHSEFSQKSCPGSSINKDWFVNLVDNYVTDNNYKLLKLENNKIIKSYKFNDDYYIKLSDIEHIIKPLGFIDIKNKTPEKEGREEEMVLLRKGSKGQLVVELQKKLIALGYDLKPYGADGDFGVLTDRIIREFQQDNKITVDGIVGSQTMRLINSLLENKQKVQEPIQQPKQEEKKYKYYQIASTHIIEVNPLDLKITEERDKQGRFFNVDNFVTASFIGHHPDGATYPTTILVSEGNIINNTQPNGLYSGKYVGKGIPAPTFIVYKDGSVAQKILNDITQEKDVWFAISGFGCLPYTTSGFSQFVGSVAYKTHRVGIAYRSKDNKVLLVYRPSTTAARLKSTFENLGCDFGLSTDSGGSANFKVDGKFIHSTTRRIYAGITW